MRYGNPYGTVVPSAIYAGIDPDAPSARILTWTPEHTTGVVHHVLVDDVEIAVTAETELLDFPQNARDSIEIIETSTINSDEDVSSFVDTPLDKVQLTWAEVTGAVRYEVYRKVSGGEYSTPMATLAAGLATYTLTDGPLSDETYVYKVRAYDAAGNYSESDEDSVALDAAPEPPSGLALTFNNDTHIVTLTWTASPDADLGAYDIYRGDPPELLAAPYATDAASPWTEDLTGVTDHLQYLLRAKDDEGRQEANLSQMVAIEVTAGVQVLIPNSPTILTGQAIADGEVRLTVRYDRDGATGVATSVQLYVNDGAGGAMDWGTSVGTADLATGFSLEIVDIDSTGLTGGLTYLCGVRAKTAEDVEDANTETISVVTDATAPAAPDVTATVV
jgi:fibronectin type 3 domain-containing protein